MASMSAFSFSILPAMLSGPTAFLGLMLLMRFSMPFLEIEMFFMIGCVLGPLSGISVFASDEKAEWNWLGADLTCYQTTNLVEIRIPKKFSICS